jgi:hypothetical protein
MRVREGMMSCEMGVMLVGKMLHDVRDEARDILGVDYVV